MVVRREFTDLLERARYQIHSPLIPTDTLVYTESEFTRLAATPGTLVADAIGAAVGL